MKINQNDTLLTHLGRGKTITRLEAMFDFGIQNITARVTDIRNAGVDVLARIKADPKGRKYAQYYITAGEIEHAINTGLVVRTENDRLWLKDAA